ncbi:hypothetical protein [Streptomyces sp. 840.1]|uniref:hypothetical protein n=1 Tax=Streptomyces sp. 840.1 TaxID=2485152 RepID=UPI0011CE8177|nr:hypothetical protein [Streptomyces sp. 840.1]
MKTRQTATGIAAALEAAGLLQSPESAAEQLELLRQRDAFRDQRNSVFATNEELLLRVERADLERLQTENDNRTLARRIAELEATLSRIGARAEQRHLLDPLDHVLEHLADERPVLTEEQARRIERDRPETTTAHDCTTPLSRLLACGHCPHQVCEDCGRCPHTCGCSVLAVTS